MNRFGKQRRTTEEMYRHTDMAANLSEHDIFRKGNAPGLPNVRATVLT